MNLKKEREKATEVKRDNVSKGGVDSHGSYTWKGRFNTST